MRGGPAGGDLNSPAAGREPETDRPRGVLPGSLPRHTYTQVVHLGIKKGVCISVQYIC